MDTTGSQQLTGVLSKTQPNYHLHLLAITSHHIIQFQFFLFLFFIHLNLLLLQVDCRSFGKQVRWVAASEARLNVKNRHVPPNGWAVVGCGVRAGGAGFILEKLKETFHVRPQAGHNPCPHCCHRLLIAGQQGLQQCDVVSVNLIEDTKSGSQSIFHQHAKVFIYIQLCNLFNIVIVMLKSKIPMCAFVVLFYSLIKKIN